MRIAWERHGAGDPLLLIHGLGYARWGWEPVLPGLAERFDVLLFDNRGIGASPVTPGPYSTPEMAEDAEAVVAALGLGQVDVAGSSMGGAICQEWALCHPDRIRKVVRIYSAACGNSS